MGRQRHVWLIRIADERVGVQVKLRDPLRTRVIPERFCGDDSRKGVTSSVRTFTFTFSFIAETHLCGEVEAKLCLSPHATNWMVLLIVSSCETSAPSDFRVRSIGRLH